MFNLVLILYVTSTQPWLLENSFNEGFLETDLYTELHNSTDYRLHVRLLL